jgi:twitching motility protein PilT
MTIKQIFQDGVDHKASDIHILNDEPPIIRVLGKLSRLDKYGVINKKKAEDLVLSILSPKQKEKYLTNRELDLAYQLETGERFRINLHFEKGSPSLVARIISTKIPTMEEILMPDIVFQLSRLHQGLIIITGPTGCGKSTSLAAIINMINNERACNIITLEDPIEYVFAPKKSIIRQRQYGFDFLSFPDALKHVLRQDPNVIMVGEMRDLETIASTITLAETGHLVLATLHTPNAAQTIDRIIDIFPPHQQEQIRMQLSMSLVGVIAQQLIPAKDGKGRVTSREIMINTPAVANLIRENKIAQLKTVIQTSSDESMMTMDQSLDRLTKEGLIDKETAGQYITNGTTIK